jgi:putative Holliday junction resolvase
LLAERLGIEVVYWDERLTTVAAEKVLLNGDVSRRKRKKVIDKLAAVLILQNYLDWKSSRQP